MDSEEIWRIWEILSVYINNRDKEDAIEEFLQHIYETDACEISDLRACADDYNDELFSVSGNELTALKSVNLTVIFSIVNARLIFYVDGVSVYTYNAETVTNTTVTRTFSVSQGSKIKITARYENGDFVGHGASAYATID